MRKTFELTHPRHKPAQALDRVKSQIHKYLRRERGKGLPEGADYWAFDCRVGVDEATAVHTHVAELGKRIDALARDGVLAAYVEILAKPGVRTRRPPEHHQD